MAATGQSSTAPRVTTDPITPPDRAHAGNHREAGGDRERVLLAGCRTGAVAVRITEPIPVAVTCTGVGEVVCPAEIKHRDGAEERSAAAEMANVTVSARSGGHGGPDREQRALADRQRRRERRHANAGAGCTVSVVSPVTGPTDVVTVALIVVVPTVKAVARPLLPMEATD